MKKSKKEPAVRTARMPFVMFPAEMKAFDEAIAKANPLASRSKVLRLLIQRYVEEQKIAWPGENQ